MTESRKKIYAASDHAGFRLKEHVVQQLRSKFGDRFEIEDLGCNSETTVDYPKYAAMVAERISKEPDNFGLLVCGSGQGMCIAANRHRNVRAALCMDLFSAKLVRTHNNANVLCLAGRITAPVLAADIAEMFFKTPFSNEERHARRIALIDNNR